MKYWLGVVSREHVLKGVLGEFAQVCHGKRAPLLKMAAGDGFIYYSPKMALGSIEACKCFTALGKIRTGKVYQVEMFPDFHLIDGVETPSFRVGRKRRSFLLVFKC